MCEREKEKSDRTVDITPTSQFMSPKFSKHNSGSGLDWDWTEEISAGRERRWIESSQFQYYFLALCSFFWNKSGFFFHHSFKLLNALFVIWLGRNKKWSRNPSFIDAWLWVGRFRILPYSSLWYDFIFMCASVFPSNSVQFSFGDKQGCWLDLRKTYIYFVL